MINLTKSSNPALKENIFHKDFSYSSEAMTINGTMNKTALMLLIVMAGAIFTWNKFFAAIAVNPEGGAAAVMPWLIVGGIGGLITALVTAFRPQSSGISAPIYAIFEGLLLGGISAIFESMYTGIVMRAVALTLAVFLAMLFLYRSGIIKVTEKLKMGIFAATAGIAVVYLVSFIGGFSGWNFLSFTVTVTLVSVLAF